MSLCTWANVSLEFFVKLGKYMADDIKLDQGGGCLGLAASAISDGQQKALFTHAGEFK